MVSQGVSHRTFESPDELAPDDLSFALGIGHPRQRVEEDRFGVHGDQLGAGGGDEVVLHLLAFPGAQQPMVDEHTRQPVTDGTLHQRRGHRGVHAAGQSADGVAVADLFAHLLDQRLGDAGGRPGGVDAA